MRFLVTGTAGFIGFHVARRLLLEGHYVAGVDNLNNYYDPRLKEARLATLRECAISSPGTLDFYRGNLADKATVVDLFNNGQFDRVIHLAAQAGVRHSLEHPDDYVQSNLVAFVHILEACRHSHTPHLIYASTSSVYGSNKKTPSSEEDSVDHPLQLYAATKRANELMAHSYSHLFDLPTTGLRFFTVYGPWGRPDMAPWLFTEAILRGEPISLFNNGNHARDFTYIDDIVEGILRAASRVPQPGTDNFTPNQSTAPFQIFNVGNSNPVSLSDFVLTLEQTLGRSAHCNFAPAQPGDVLETFADISLLYHATGYAPKVSLNEGLERFVEWLREYRP